jgi:hypothetical protein
MGSEGGVFIIIRNLEVFGGQPCHLDDIFIASYCSSYYVASWNSYFTEVWKGCILQTKIDDEVLDSCVKSESKLNSIALGKGPGKHKI